MQGGVPLPSPDGQQSAAPSHEPQPSNLPSCVHSERPRLADPESIQRPSVASSFPSSAFPSREFFPVGFHPGCAMAMLLLSHHWPGDGTLQKGTLGDLGADRCAWRFPGAWARGPCWTRRLGHRPPHQCCRFVKRRIRQCSQTCFYSSVSGKIWTLHL